MVACVTPARCWARRPSSTCPGEPVPCERPELVDRRGVRREFDAGDPPCQVGGVLVEEVRRGAVERGLLVGGHPDLDEPAEVLGRGETGGRSRGGEPRGLFAELLHGRHRDREPTVGDASRPVDAGGHL